MIFSSATFIFAFLPVVLLVSVLTRRLSRGPVAMLLWLTMASLFFYGFWKADYLPIIVTSIGVNWVIGRWITAAGSRKRVPLFVGVLFNLVTIGYYKYFDFFVSNINSTLGTEVPELGLLLPLGISFFTFQQIAYLVDTSKGLTGKTSFLEYAFFVSFFPQLIAGPIVHHRHILPTIKSGEAFSFDSEQFLKGLHGFAIGFAKKVVIADSLALAASNVFNAADAGQSITPHDAMLATLSYTFQIYFDFSGYTDMAIGLGLMFGIKLPKNFDSPYKATSIIDFWRRWHITLSEFLRDYVYFPLGGNRKGIPRRYFNLLSTMFIGGLWHGASWTFVLWGVTHGVLLMVNHYIRVIIPKPTGPVMKPAFRLVSWFVTFVIVALTWVSFRATTWNGMLEIYHSILLPFSSAGVAQATTSQHVLDETALPYLYAFNISETSISGWSWVLLAAVLSFLMPNTWRLLQRFDEYRGIHRFGANALTVVMFSTASFVILYFANRVSEFIYFNF